MTIINQKNNGILSLINDLISILNDLQTKKEISLYRLDFLQVAFQELIKSKAFVEMDDRRKEELSNYYFDLTYLLEQLEKLEEKVGGTRLGDIILK